MLPTYETVVRNTRLIDYVEDVYTTRGTPLTLIQADQPSGSYPDAPARELTVQMNNGAPCLCEFGIAGHRFEATMQPGDFVVTPPGERSEFDLHGPTRPLVAAIPSDDLAGRMGVSGRADLADLGGLHEGMHRDRRVIAWLRALWAAREDAAAPALFVETGALALTHRLVQLSERCVPIETSTPGLTPRAARRVIDYVEAHLADSIHLNTLAALACLSEYQFLRAFKASFGDTPHQYLVARRLAAARHALAHTGRSMAAIAADTGFASQSHLCRLFKQATGVSPGAYRRAIQF